MAESSQKFTILVVNSQERLRNSVIRVLQALDPAFHFDFHYMTTDDHRLAEWIKRAHVIIAEPIIVPLLENPTETCPNLRWFMSTYAGVDQFLKLHPSPQISPPPYTVTRSAGLYGPMIAEFVIGNIIMVQRNLIQMYETRQRQESPFSTRSQYTKFLQFAQMRIGIMGATGSVGQDIARRVYALGSQCWGLCRRQRKEGEPPVTPQLESHLNRHGLPPADKCFQRIFATESKGDALKEFIGGVDVLINTLPDTPDTRYMLGGAPSGQSEPDIHPLQWCKPNCIFINVGRGSVISENELIRALKNNWIQSAIIDVFEQEPLPESSILVQADIPSQRLILSPHVSGIQQIDNLFDDILAKNLDLFSKGMIEERKYNKKWVPDLHYIVDWKLGY
ncbi:MAG: putative Glyoxylate/hydroxypyruvate reductase A [Streblomastix strix]|uniref:Putative Glyoxylate/hydroxypyruvate reductase A n=1 Tax=Streblomastix strix TaxID=222440 RepID=A0A5J4WPV5_9EUKA|nr:MAG: putative Glyoxylate/hydroxypyruvate reductase A [Streblomastix strix]